MAYKDLLVALDAGSDTRQRLQLAAALTARFDAHLVGLFVARAPEPLALMGIADAAAVESLSREAEHSSLDQAAAVRRLVAQHIVQPQYGFLGGAYVNVLQLNEALARMR